MEGREGITISGVTVVGSDAPSDYHVASRSDTPATTGVSAPPQLVALATTMEAPLGAALTMPTKKKRGRPRKYGADGSVTKTLSPKPISSAPPPVIDFSLEKRGKLKPANSVSKSKYEFGNLGNGRCTLFRICTFSSFRRMDKVFKISCLY